MLSDVRFWHLAAIGLRVHMSAFDPKRTLLRLARRQH